MTAKDESKAAPASNATNADNDDESFLLFSDDEDSDDEDFFPSASEACTMKDLEQEFRKRDKLLKKLVKGIDSTYARIMQENEQAVRKKKLLRLKKKETKGPTSVKNEDASYLTSLNDDEHHTKKIGMWERLYRMFVFDIHNTLQAILVLVLNNIAYTGFAQVVRSFVGLVASDDPRFVPVALVLSSVVVLRLTGGLCQWVTESTYARIKFDMNNRLRLGKWDAVLMKWFLQHDFLSRHLNAVAFFAVNYAVYIYQEQVFVKFFDIRHDLLQHLPSAKQGVISYVGERLSSGLDKEHVHRVLGDATCAAGVCDLSEFDVELNNQDETFLYSSVAPDCYESLMGNQAAGLYTETNLFLFYTGSMIAAVVILRMIGIKFWSKD